MSEQYEDRIQLNDPVTALFILPIPSQYILIESLFKV